MPRGLGRPRLAAGGDPPGRRGAGRPHRARPAGPARWGRRRIALLAAADGIARWGDFGGPESVAVLLPAAARPDWERLGAELRALGVDAGVYGSHGWQALTGEDYLHPGSDLDLLLPVPDADRADRVAALLDAAPQGGALPRLDGELALPGGAAVAWREWRRWRAGGMAGTVLVKRLRGAALARGGGWLAAGGAA
ncbi:MAG: malonate decarboxylase holo-[acyl-carrier-protein] synthase [Xylophilus ampelinus]